MNLQDGFLNQIRRENAEIRLVLLDGSDMTGRVRGFDNFTVVIEDETTQRLVYKHAIAQIVQTRGEGGARVADIGALLEAAAAAAPSGHGEPGAGRREPRRDRRPDHDRRGGRPQEQRSKEPRRQEPREPREPRAPRAGVSAEAHKADSFNPLDLSKLSLPAEESPSA